MGHTAELSLYSYPILASKHMAGLSEGFTSILESNLNKFWYALNNNDTSIARKPQRFSLPLRRRWLMKILLLFRMLEMTCVPGDHMLSLRGPETCSHCGSDHPTGHSRAHAIAASPLVPAVPKYLMTLRTGPSRSPAAWRGQ